MEGLTQIAALVNEIQHFFDQKQLQKLLNLFKFVLKSQILINSTVKFEISDFKFRNWNELVRINQKLINLGF
jgi:hypothetical protein